MKPSRRPTTIFGTLKEIILGKASGTWRCIGPSALNFEKIMSKNKARYKTQLVVFYIKTTYLSNHPRITHIFFFCGARRIPFLRKVVATEINWKSPERIYVHFASGIETFDEINFFFNS